jgi:phosphomannomutase
MLFGKRLFLDSRRKETMTINWNAIVKAYDVRGLVGVDLTEEVVEAVAAGFVDELELAGLDVIVGHDMRESSPGFAAAFARGAQARGANVVSLGLCSTDQSYYASGHFKAAAAMFTASHNPAAYNGIKLSRAGARGISIDTGLAAIRDRAKVFVESGVPQVATTGAFRELDSLAGYAEYLRHLVNLSAIRPLKVVVDAGNGMGGHTVPAVLESAAGLSALPLEIVPLYFELDGNFPNHEANPLDPKNLVDLQRAVLEHQADIGLAFDGDADRCFVVDEKGGLVTPSVVGAIVAEREIQRARSNGEHDITIIHNLLTSRAVSELIIAEGAKPLRTKVGHSLIKDQMAASNAVFGAEHSAHYYFRDFWGADNGMLAAMHVLQSLGSQSAPLSEFAAAFDPYFASGEINSTVTDAKARIAAVRELFLNRADFDEFDGVTATSNGAANDWWWFNVRSSNTEPLLRLNVEAATESQMLAIRDEVLAVIRS